MRTLKPLNIDDKERLRLFNIINNTEKYDLSIITPCEIIYYYDYYMNIDDVIETLYVSRKTIFNHLKKYRKDKYYMFKSKKSSELDNYKDEIRKNFKDYPVHSYREAVTRIKNITGIERSLPQIYKFLNKEFNYYTKNADGYYTKNGEPNTEKENTYLYNHLEEIGNYIEQNPSDDKNIILNRIKNKFPEIKEEDWKIISALKDYLPF